MSWSTREIAELAGTSLRAVRHYHDVGLLPEPERRSNGYKQYGVAHLVRLLRIKRLVDLGLPLSRIAEMGEDDHHPEEALRVLDAELGATIERLQRARVELGLILRHHAPADLPADFATARGVAQMTEADRSFVLVMSRVMGPQRLDAYAEMLRDERPDPTGGEFDALRADAGEETRQGLAERMVPYIRGIRAEYPDAAEPHAGAPRGARQVAEIAAAAMRELYNPAQVDVLRRVRALLRTADGPHVVDDVEGDRRLHAAADDRRQPGADGDHGVVTGQPRVGGAVYGGEPQGGEHEPDGQGRRRLPARSRPAALRRASSRPDAARRTPVVDRT